MPETKVISTVTQLSTFGSNIAIKTFYQKDELPDTIEAFIADSVGSQNGVSYIEGELNIQMKNSPQNLNYSIDNNGNLILSINTGDGLNYSVNASGQLEYTS